MDRHLARRFHTNDRQLRYRRLPYKMYSDTLQASTKDNERSWRRKNKYAQVFCTDFGWIWCYPMKARSDAPNALNTLLHDKGEPKEMIVDGAKEQTMGDFQ